MKKVLVVVGPTAVGKTKISISLAKHYGIDIISGDSVAIYKRLDIGSAKPTKEEMDGVCHHFIDIKDPKESYSACDFQREARKILDVFNYNINDSILYVKETTNRRCVNELIHRSPLPDKNISIKKSELEFVADSNSELLVCPICGELTKKPKSINCNEIYKCIWCNCDFKLKEEIL